MMQEKFCPNCGNRMDMNANFCQICGYSFQNSIYPNTNNSYYVSKTVSTIGGLSLSALICSLVSFFIAWFVSTTLGNILCVISLVLGSLGVTDDKKNSRNPTYAILSIFLSIVVIITSFLL